MVRLIFGAIVLMKANYVAIAFQDDNVIVGMISRRVASVVNICISVVYNFYVDTNSKSCNCVGCKNTCLHDLYIRL